MSGLLHYGAALVVAVLLTAIWRDTYRFIARDVVVRSRFEEAFTGLIATIPPALVAAAAFVLGARL